MYPIIRFLLLILVSTIVISCGSESSTDPTSLVDAAPIAPPGPPSPTGLAATANGASTIDLSWSAVSVATLYEIYRNTSNTSSSSTLIDEPLASAGTSYQDTGLTASTTYYYWIKACDTNGCSDYSSFASAITPLASPTGLAATVNGIGAVNLSWSVASAATLYQIYRNTTGTSSTSTLIGQPLASAGASYQDTGLTASTAYYYWIKACDANGCSDYSNFASAITPLASPTGLTATANGSSVIDLSWSAVSAATLYQIYRNTSNTSSSSTFIDAPQASAGTSYQDTGLTASTTYYYWLVACDDTSCSDYSLVSVTTQIDIPGTGNLNDTGIYWGGDYPEGNNSSCTSNISSPQDCHQGRDAQAAEGILSKTGAGSAGFDFTKLGANGTVLAIQDATYADNGNESDGTKWSCVRDNHTGFVWEVKSNDGNSIHYKDTEYRWGGLTAIGRDHASKKGDYYDDWNDLVTGTNSENLCGFSDWRAPNIEELSSIVNYSLFSLGLKSSPSINTHYFPNTAADYFWSASPYANNSALAWRLHFYDGDGHGGFRTITLGLRLLRAGQ